MIKNGTLCLILGIVVLATAGCNAGGGGESSNSNSDFVTQMAMKTQGDASKLSADERKKLDDITKNRTEEVLKFHPASQMAPAPARGG
jgi:hypothetical protein